MIKKSFLILLLFCVPLQAQQLNLSVYAEVSIVTVGPGKHLYEAFGHTTIRVKDPVLQLDIAYNYGVFDYNAPNFYANFTKGKLVYKLARYPFYYFVKSNAEDKRWIKEQVLQLTTAQVQQLFSYLENNAKEENASYLYDPFFNNCATKPMTILNDLFGDVISLDTSYVQQKESLRQLMNQEIHWNSWGNLGINLALGTKLDQPITAEGYLYLPDYVYLAISKATISDDSVKKPFVKKEQQILDFEEIYPSNSAISPFLVFSILAIMGIWITYRDYTRNKRTKILDFILLFSTGLIGAFILFLWCFTNHSTTPNNLNALWCFAPNLVVAFIALKNKRPNWFQKYTLVVLAGIIAIPFVLIFNIQGLPLAAIPVYVILGLRYVYLITSTDL